MFLIIKITLMPCSALRRAYYNPLAVLVNFRWMMERFLLVENQRTGTTGTEQLN